MKKKILMSILLSSLALLLIACGNDKKVEGPKTEQSETDKEAANQDDSEDVQINDVSKNETNVPSKEEQTQQNPSDSKPSETKPTHTHNYKLSTSTNPSCEVAGSKKYACECGHSYVETVQALGHKYGEYVYNNDATQNADGTKSRVCEKCNKKETITAEGTKLPVANSYLNYNEMNFYINGKKYTLGKTTLRQLVNDGICFTEADKTKANEMIKPNERSLVLTMRSSDGGNIADICVENNSNTNVIAYDLPISTITYEKDYARPNVIAFDFPIDLKEADLKAKEASSALQDCWDTTTNLGRNVRVYYYGKGVNSSTVNRTYLLQFFNGVLDSVGMDYRK